MIYNIFDRHIFECNNRVSLAQILTDPAGIQAFVQHVPGYLGHDAICRALTKVRWHGRI